MSAFVDALRNGLICSRCGAMNRPGAYLIELDRDGLAVCGQCGHGWNEPLLKRTEIKGGLTVRSAT